MEGPSKKSGVINNGRGLKLAGEYFECTERVVLDTESYLKLTHVDGWIHEIAADGQAIAEEMSKEYKPKVTKIKEYFKVKRSMYVRKGPDMHAALVHRDGKSMMKAENEIVQCCGMYHIPKSNMYFVQLVQGDGWLVKNLQDGTQVLEHAGGEICQDGKFYYIVKISVGARLEPSIMANRSGLGFKMNTIIEGVQRFTPPESTITYVKLAHGQGWVFETTMDAQLVLERIHKVYVRKVERTFYKLLQTMKIVAKPDVNSQVLHARTVGSIIECSECLQLEENGIMYLKLRHDAGWAYDRNEEDRILLVQVQGEPTTDEAPKMYKVLRPVEVRSAPDTECSLVPSVSAKEIGAIVSSSIRYKPPGSLFTFIKLLHERGWVLESGKDGVVNLEDLGDAPSRKQGKFYYKSLQNLVTFQAPEPDAAQVGAIEKGCIFSADMKFISPDNDKVTYIRLMSDKSWLVHDKSIASLQPVTESIFNAYVTPPSWLAIGYPIRKWFAVPTTFGAHAFVEETLRQMDVFKSKNLLAASSQGHDDFPLSRQGHVGSGPSQDCKVALEEIKHAANPLLVSFQWKQLWWVFTLEGTKHAIEVQHGIRGGYRKILFDGQVVHESRPVSGFIWDSGSSHSFERAGHQFDVAIRLEGRFFSTYLQFFSYILQMDGSDILQECPSA